MLGFASLSRRFAAVINVNRSRLQVSETHRNGGTLVRLAHSTLRSIPLLNLYRSLSSGTWLVNSAA